MYRGRYVDVQVFEEVVRYRSDDPESEHGEIEYGTGQQRCVAVGIIFRSVLLNCRILRGKLQFELRAHVWLK